MAIVSSLVFALTVGRRTWQGLPAAAVGDEELQVELSLGDGMNDLVLHDPNSNRCGLPLHDPIRIRPGNEGSGAFPPGT